MPCNHLWVREISHVKGENEKFFKIFQEATGNVAYNIFLLKSGLKQIDYIHTTDVLLTLMHIFKLWWNFRCHEDNFLLIIHNSLLSIFELHDSWDGELNTWNSENAFRSGFLRPRVNILRTLKNLLLHDTFGESFDTFWKVSSKGITNLTLGFTKSVLVVLKWFHKYSINFWVIENWT